MFLYLLSKFFSFIVETRNFLFDTKIFSIVRANSPVISIGNVSFGGTGKTPFTILLARLLLERNIKPAILSRGYKRIDKKIQIVEKNKNAFSWEQIGDEMYLTLQKLDVPLVISPKKYKAIPFINKLENCDVILVDDGFQHRKLHRDLDIVLIDKETLNKPYLFPKGILREPLKNLKRADFILLEDGVDEQNKQHLAQFSERILKYRKVIKDFYNSNNEKVNPQELANEKIALVSAIGRNENFRQSLEKLFPEIVIHFKFRDHHYYSTSDVEKIIEQIKILNIHYLVTTEKDYVKLKTFQKKFIENGIELVVAVLELEVEKIELILYAVEKILKNYAKPK